jgi:hypothetical protein
MVNGPLKLAGAAPALCDDPGWLVIWIKFLLWRKLPRLQRALAVHPLPTAALLSSQQGTRHVECRRRAACGRFRRQCPRRSESEKRREIARAQNRRGKARSSQNALKHGLRAQKYLVLPEEDAGEFAALEAALLQELAPVGAMQTLLARRVAVAAWRLARADRLEVEVLQQHQVPQCGLGLAVIRDGNGTRSFETLLRYRSAAMAEFWRALKTLKALQAEQADGLQTSAGGHAAAERTAPAPPAQIARRPMSDHPEARRNTNEPRPQAQPDEPERAAPRRLECAATELSIPHRMLHEPAALWLPNEPESGRAGCTGRRRAASGRLP